MPGKNRVGRTRVSNAQQAGKTTRRLLGCDSNHALLACFCLDGLWYYIRSTAFLFVEAASHEVRLKLFPDRRSPAATPRFLQLLAEECKSEHQIFLFLKSVTTPPTSAKTKSQRLELQLEGRRFSLLGTTT